MDKTSEAEKRRLRLLERRNVLATRVVIMIAAAQARVKNTQRMIAQSKTLLGKAREALESSRLLRAALRRSSGSGSRNL